MVSNGYIVSNRRFSIQAKNYFTTVWFKNKILPEHQRRCIYKNMLNNVSRLLSVNQKLPIFGKNPTSFLKPFENQFLIVRTVAVIAKIRIAAHYSNPGILDPLSKIPLTFAGNPQDHSNAFGNDSHSIIFPFLIPGVIVMYYIIFFKKGRIYGKSSIRTAYKVVLPPGVKFLRENERVAFVMGCTV